MKKIMILAVALSLFLALALVPAIAAPPTTRGFDEFGYNYNACLFNGWYGYYDRVIDGGWVAGTGDARLIMKWSKDWTPMADQPIGAWCTNHFTWYGDDYDEASWYGWDTRMSWEDKDLIPEAECKVEEFLKLMKVGDDPVEWAEYEAGGAYSAGWGAYPSGVPKYVVFQDVVSVYRWSWNLINDWALEFDYLGTKYNHDMSIDTQTDGSFSGTGACPATTWTVTGTVSGDDLTMTIAYDDPSTYEVAVIGTLAADGTMSGTWSSNAGQTGTWINTAGQASTIYDNLIATYDLCTTSPKGLGQPIF